MEIHKAKKVVIIIEAFILDNVIEVITKFGASGYTVQTTTGKGERGMRSESSFSGLFKNARIEIITSEEVGKKIADEVIEKFFKNYAGIVYMQDVESIRATS